MHGWAKAGDPDDKLAVSLLDLGFGDLLRAARQERGEVVTEVIGNALNASAGKLIDDRNAARAAKNWAESDRIRAELATLGIALQDNKDGTTSWELKR